MRSLWIILSVVLFAGCASPSFGPEATYLLPATKPKLKITSRYNGAMCTESFAHLSISIENKSDRWKELKNLELAFPYQSKDQFEIVQGERLESWAIAEEARQGRNNHNSKLARMAAAGTADHLLQSETSEGKAIGGAIGTALISSQINREARMAEIAKSQYLFQDQLIVPPNMDRQYWFVLSDKKDAPLMDHFEISYIDENGNNQRFNVPLDNWFKCRWQKERVSELKTWALVNQHTKVMKKYVRDGKVSNKEAIQIEALLQSLNKEKTSS